MYGDQVASRASTMVLSCIVYLGTYASREKKVYSFRYIIVFDFAIWKNKT